MGMIQDFQKADKERQGEIAAIVNEAEAFVKDLAKGSARRRSDVATMIKDLAKGDTQRAAEVVTMLKEADNFVEDLAKGSAQRRSDVATMLKEADEFVEDLAKGSAQRRSEVVSMLKEADNFVEDLVKGSVRRRIEVWGKVPGKKMAPVVKAVPVGELRDRVFAYLADHPDGTKLAKLEEQFGVARIQIARVIRGLIDDNKVEKRDLLYFAI